jgi:hypothetical protein
MDKRRTRADSAHQTGLKPTLHAFLIVVESGDSGGEKSWRNFLLSDFGDVLANLATTNKAMDKWRLRLDSAGQKGPEITLKGILIVVEGCFTAEICTTCFCSLSLALTTPKPRAQVLGCKTPLFLANWQRVPQCFGRWLHSTHARPLAMCPFSKCLCGPVVWKGSLDSLNTFG